MEPNIFFIGPRASGKSSLGRKMAMRLGRPFVDTDHFFADHTGAPIATYVEEHGWEGFRDMEAEVFAAVCRNAGQIVACGGGIPLRPENRQLMKSGVVFYLKTAPHTLAERLALDPNHDQRPSLTGESIEAEIETVLEEREPLYEKCADVILPGGETQAELADMVEKELARVTSAGSR